MGLARALNRVGRERAVRPFSQSTAVIRLVVEWADWLAIGRPFSGKLTFGQMGAGECCSAGQSVDFWLRRNPGSIRVMHICDIGDKPAKWIR